MLYCKHRTIIFFSGMVWLVVGISLLTLGLRFIISSLSIEEISHPSFSLLDWFGKEKVAREKGAIFMITLALLLGFFKGKYILAKSAHREIKRVITLPNPAPIKYFYSKKYYILLGIMMLLGMVMRQLPIASDTRGVIDIIIGSALIKGALFYYRHLFNSLSMHSHE